ncbi:hypothetical protein MKW92_013840, partial [Papaver armeniacum]
MSCFASKSNILYKKAIEGIDELFARIIDDHNKVAETEKTTQVLNSEIPNGVAPEKSFPPFIENPHVSQVKGRPSDKEKEKRKTSSTSRMLSFVESTGVKKRKCSNCKNTGHDKRNCPKPPDSEQLNIVELG